MVGWGGVLAPGRYCLGGRVGTVWYGMVWRGRFGTVRHGMVGGGFGMVW